MDSKSARPPLLVILVPRQRPSFSPPSTRASTSPRPSGTRCLGSDSIKPSGRKTGRTNTLSLFSYPFCPLSPPSTHPPHAQLCSRYSSQKQTRPLQLSPPNDQEHYIPSSLRPKASVNASFTSRSTQTSSTSHNLFLIFSNRNNYIFTRRPHKRRRQYNEDDNTPPPPPDPDQASITRLDQRDCHLRRRNVVIDCSPLLPISPLTSHQEERSFGPLAPTNFTAPSGLTPKTTIAIDSSQQ